MNPQRRSLLRAASVSAAGLTMGACALPRAGDTCRRGRPVGARPAHHRPFKKPLAFRKQDFLITAYGAAPCKAIMVKGYVGTTKRARSARRRRVRRLLCGDCGGHRACQRGRRRARRDPGRELAGEGPDRPEVERQRPPGQGAHVYFSNNPTTSPSTATTTAAPTASW
jgi:hypothetical protein